LCVRKTGYLKGPRIQLFSYLRDGDKRQTGEPYQPSALWPVTDLVSSGMVLFIGIHSLRSVHLDQLLAPVRAAVHYPCLLEDGDHAGAAACDTPNVLGRAVADRNLRRGRKVGSTWCEKLFQSSCDEAAQKRHCHTLYFSASCAVGRGMHSFTTQQIT
jgi:hypothetical protein